MSAAANEAFARVERLLADLEVQGDAAQTARARAIAGALLDVHAEGLARMLQIAAAQGEAGRALGAAFAADPFVASLLLLHGVHPVGLDARVRSALAELAPRLAADGLRAELPAIEDGAVVVQLHATRTPPGNAARAVRALEDALVAAAPDAASIAVDDVSGAGAGLIPIERLVRSATRPAAARPDAERCDLCGAVIDPQHEHLLDPERRELTCACTACALLFEARDGARHLRVRRRVERLADFVMSDAAWRALGIPVGLAYVCRAPGAAESAATAFYPSAAGLVATPVAHAAWEGLAAENPVLGDLAPDVEALLVNRTNGAAEHWRVSIDECFRLTGIVRTSCTNLSGSLEAPAAIEQFFAGLRRAS